MNDCQMGYHPRKGTRGKGGQRGGRLDWSKEKGHFMSKLNQCVKMKKFRLALQIKGSSKLMQTLVKSGFSFALISESPLNLNWKSEFSCLLCRVQCISGRKRF